MFSGVKLPWLRVKTEVFALNARPSQEAKGPNGIPVVGVPLPRGLVMSTFDVSAIMPDLAMTRKLPDVDPAVKSPPLVIVPPVAVNVTETGTLSPSAESPYALNCLLAPGANVAPMGSRVTLLATGFGAGAGGGGGVAGAVMVTITVSARVPAVLVADTR
jgi:hypothetical protein